MRYYLFIILFLFSAYLFAQKRFRIETGEISIGEYSRSSDFQNINLLNGGVYFNSGLMLGVRLVDWNRLKTNTPYAIIPTEYINDNLYGVYGNDGVFVEGKEFDEIKGTSYLTPQFRLMLFSKGDNQRFNIYAFGEYYWNYSDRTPAYDIKCKYYRYGLGAEAFLVNGIRLFANYSYLNLDISSNSFSGIAHERNEKPIVYIPPTETSNSVQIGISFAFNVTENECYSYVQPIGNQILNIFRIHNVLKKAEKSNDYSRVEQLAECSSLSYNEQARIKRNKKYKAYLSEGKRIEQQKFEELLKKAQDGDLDSQIQIAEKYESQKKTSDAIYWYGKAGENGDAKSHTKYKELCNSSIKLIMVEGGWKKVNLCGETIEEGTGDYRIK